MTFAGRTCGRCGQRPGTMRGCRDRRLWQRQRPSTSSHRSTRHPWRRPCRGLPSPASSPDSRRRCSCRLRSVSPCQGRAETIARPCGWLRVARQALPPRGRRSSEGGNDAKGCSGATGGPAPGPGPQARGLARRRRRLAVGEGQPRSWHGEGRWARNAAVVRRQASARDSLSAVAFPRPRAQRHDRAHSRHVSPLRREVGGALEAQAGRSRLGAPG